MNTALDMRFCAEPYTLGVGSGWGPDFPAVPLRDVIHHLSAS